jgi:hypothetical protein
MKNTFLNIMTVALTAAILYGCGGSGSKSVPATNADNEANIDISDNDMQPADGDETGNNISKIDGSLDDDNITFFKNKLIPEGYRLFEEGEMHSVIDNSINFFEKMRGDLNGDGIEDYAIIIKATDPNGFEQDDDGNKTDRNRRGIIIIFGNGNNGYLPALENRRCFTSENEDGGVYFPPDLSIKIEKGNLYICYNHGRYGWWQYTFRYRNAEFELIGYDYTECISGVIQEERSVKKKKKKRLVKVNVNEDRESEPIFKEKWKNINTGEL